MIKFIYKHTFKPILFRKDPEDVHDSFIKAGHLLGKFIITRKFLSLLFRYNSKILTQQIEGITFANPVGLSEGFDKDGYLVNILPSIGFGFSQVGTITLNAYKGNPKPRLTRLKESKGIIVYYGLKNEGVEKINKRLNNLKISNFPIGLSIGKTNNEYTSSQIAGIKDYVDCSKYLIEHNKIGSFYTINISCPNTFGGEPFTTPESLDLLMIGLAELNFDKPVFVKMPVDKTEKEFLELVRVLDKFEFVKGLIISNLIKNRDIESLSTQDRETAIKVQGGISGKPVERSSNKLISATYKFFGKRFVIVGVGGIFSAEDAYLKIRLGASLVQLITGMIFEGPTLISDINRGLVKLLKRDGLAHISDAVGVDVT